MNSIIKQISQQYSWKDMTGLANWVVEEAIRIQQIAAPTFAEEHRAAYVSQQFEQFGLSDVHTDDAKNVLGRWAGSSSHVPGLMVMAHTDTVFAADTDLTIRRNGTIIFGPGLGDNSIGVAGLLGAIKWLRETGFESPCDIWFVATSCEEGLGDLKGVRAAYEALQAKISAVINIEGLALGHIYHAGIAVHRMHITAHADGGHSWLHFGRPSAVHGIMELGARITALTPPSEPRTTFNIGLIEGGQGINVISTSAGLWLDLRSEEQKSLDRIREQVHKLIDASTKSGLTFHVEVVGNRPSGKIPVQHTLVQGALAALEEIGLRGTLETGSTDGNIPLSAGCPTVTIGITRGGNAHRLDEYVETEHVPLGMKQLLTLLMATSKTLAS